MAPTQILTNLFLGDAADAVEWAPTVGLDKRRAMVCVLEACPLNIASPPYHFHIHLIGTASDNLVSPASLEAVSTILGYFRNKGWELLIHCGAGIERSPLAVAWYLANHIAASWYQDHGIDPIFTLDKAYKFIMSKRPQMQDRQQWIASV